MYRQMQAAGMMTFSASTEVAADAAPAVPLIVLVQQLLACQDQVKLAATYCCSACHCRVSHKHNLHQYDMLCRTSERFTKMSRSCKSYFMQ